MSFDLSTSTYVYGIVPADAAWQRMKAVWDSCKAANVEPPDEVMRFFDWEEPDDAGVVINLDEFGAAREWKPSGNSMREGVEVEVAALPPGVKVIRFVNSY